MRTPCKKFAELDVSKAEISQVRKGVTLRLLKLTQSFSSAELTKPK